MKTYFEVDKLKKAVKEASSIVPTRTTKDVLYCIKMTSDSNGECRLEATDSESSIVRVVDGADVREPGQILVNAVKIKSILAELKGDRALIDSDGSDVTISCGYFTITIPSWDPNDFPSLGSFSSSFYYSMPGSAMRKILRRTMPFHDEAAVKNLNLAGVRFCRESDGKCLFCGTDGRVASVCSEGVSITGERPESEQDVTLGLRGAKSLVECLNDSGAVDFFCDGSVMRFRCGLSSLSCRLVDGKYPNIQKLLGGGDFSPDATYQTIAGPFRDSCRQSLLATNQETVAVGFSVKDGTMTLSSAAADSGRAIVSLPVTEIQRFPVKGDTGETTFRLNPRYTLTALNEVEDHELITLEINKAGVMFLLGDGWKFMQAGIQESK